MSNSQRQILSAEKTRSCDGRLHNVGPEVDCLAMEGLDADPRQKPGKAKGKASELCCLQRDVPLLQRTPSDVWFSVHGQGLCKDSDMLRASSVPPDGSFKSNYDSNKNLKKNIRKK